MSKIAKFDGTTLPLLRKEINDALEAIGAKLGVALKLGNIRYNDMTFSAKLEAAVVQKDAPSQDPSMIKYAADYKRWAPIYGWPISLLTGGSVVYGGKSYAILGYNTRGKRYPIVARSMADNKIYKLPTRAVEIVN